MKLGRVTQLLHINNCFNFLTRSLFTSAFFNILAKNYVTASIIPQISSTFFAQKKGVKLVQLLDFTYKNGSLLFLLITVYNFHADLETGTQKNVFSCLTTTQRDDMCRINKAFYSV